MPPAMPDFHSRVRLLRPRRNRHARPVIPERAAHQVRAVGQQCGSQRPAEAMHRPPALGNHPFRIGAGIEELRPGRVIYRRRISRVRDMRPPAWRTPIPAAPSRRPGSGPAASKRHRRGQSVVDQPSGAEAIEREAGIDRVPRASGDAVCEHMPRTRRRLEPAGAPAAIHEQDRNRRAADDWRAIRRLRRQALQATGGRQPAPAADDRRIAGWLRFGRPPPRWPAQTAVEGMAQQPRQREPLQPCATIPAWQKAAPAPASARRAAPDRRDIARPRAAPPAAVRSARSPSAPRSPAAASD